MNKKPFFWSIFPLFISITVLSGVLLLIFSVSGFRKSYTETISERLEGDAVILREILSMSENLSDAIIVNTLNKISKSSEIRYTIVDFEGRVIADNLKDPRSMDNHRDRPEIIKALNNKIGKEIRYSETLKRKLMYVAVPTSDSLQKIIVRTSLPLITIKEGIGQYSGKLTLVFLLIIFIDIFLSVIISSRIARPLKNLTAQAEVFASGKLEKTYRVYSNRETEQLADSMNKMASELYTRIKGLEYRKNIQRAVFSSMYEGIVAVDSEERIILANRAALEIFEITDGNVVGKFLQEVIRNSKIQKFVSKLMKKNLKLEKDVLVISGNDQERFIQFHGATLKDELSSGKGAVFVMHDISELKKNELMRREFVANVSHELRTPLTAIKGFVEILEEGAIDETDDRVHFLSIISRNVDRLNTITEDLLTLSSLERETEESFVSQEFVDISNIYNNVLDVCRGRADKKDLTIELIGDKSITLFCQKDLFEQAVINLLDNAIKYSQKATIIRVNCIRESGFINLSVIDEGQGIANIHLSRLFERFYRVDKARSRNAGGTGLGLSIVKHIMALHKGSVSVESILNKGSIFTLSLPYVKREKNING